jgi:hypothetical protein
MKLSRIHIWTSVLAGFFMAAASASGIFLSSAYAKESPLWAAQGTGQDYINLFIVFPVLLISAYLVSKGSIRALFIWLGLLIYIAYSYVLYSFFVTFGPLFLVYVAALGFAFYALLGGIISLIQSGFAPRITTSTKPASLYLFINGLLFSFLWLSEIFNSLRSGTIPASGADLGFIINPVQVLDLGFILPAMFLVAILLWKKHANGYIFVIPIITFTVIMAFAIISMIVVMYIRDLPTTLIPAVIMVVNVTLGSIIGFTLLKRVSQ